MLVDGADGVVRLGGAVGAELDGDREEIETANGLLDLLTTLDAGKVDVGGLNETLLTLGSVH